MAEETTDRPVCGEPADTNGWFRCQKPAGHTGDRHHTDFGVGSYTWGYAPTAEEKEVSRG